VASFPGIIGWVVADETARDALVVLSSEIGKFVRVLEGEGALYQAIKAGTGSSIWASSEAEIDAAQADATQALSGLETSRIYGAIPTVVATGFQLIENTAYWAYCGFFAKTVTIARVRWHTITGGTGAQTAEVALASSPLAPNRGDQVLTKLAAEAVVVTDLTGTGLMANDTDLAAVIPAGTHLWAGIRTAMATNEPILLARANDFGQGAILATAAAGALTEAGPWTGADVAQALTAQGPILTVTLD
jgi:hypothetical protein